MKTVFVGLSGGVDSAVSAYLLKKEGYRVVGAFIKAWEPEFLACTGVRDRLEAMRVAAALGIPFVTYDLGEEYKREVVDPFVREYKLGRTPNPDVLCNRAIKFGAFWRQAKADGADMIATGHYARNISTEGVFGLGVSRDKEKDQTYFLWTLNQDDLAHTFFPVGGLEKKDVRKIALEAKLPNAARKDSQGLCFLGHVDMRDFLKRYLPSEAGDVVDESGKTVGRHDGAWFYTIGERLALGGAEKRRYVVAKDVAGNELTVSESPRDNASSGPFRLSAMNWIAGKPGSGRMLGRYRYREPLVPVSVSDDAVSFDTPQAIASGQSLVLYDERGEICLGGTTIAP